MTRRGLASAVLPATVAAVLAAVVLSRPAVAPLPSSHLGNAAAPLRAASLNLAAARAPFFGRLRPDSIDRGRRGRV